jgi:alkanesulfonate monooxygenase SsuD/methylene tetrahydromethanopterin reductase-like flavin-dependent oxidoreductase (luciferase family)
VVGPDAIQTMTAAAVDEKVDIVREAAGERFARIEMNVRAFLVNITDDADAAAEGISSMIGVERSMVDETPFALVGPPTKLIEDLLARRERWGFSYVIVGSEDIDSFAPVVEALNGR